MVWQKVQGLCGVYGGKYSPEQELSWLVHLQSNSFSHNLNQLAFVGKECLGIARTKERRSGDSGNYLFVVFSMW